MLRELIVAALALTTAISATAQNSKITEKDSGTETDYKLPGAPMPPLLYVILRDTTAKKNAGTVTEDSKKKKRREAEAADTTPMPERLLTNKDLDNGANLFVMMFNPTCSHCEDELRLLEKNIGLFKKSQVALVASRVMRPYLPDFIRTMRTEEYPPIHVGYDSATFIGNIFLYSSLPQINIYDRKRNLIRSFTGEVAIDSLARYIE